MDSPGDGLVRSSFGRSDQEFISRTLERCVADDDRVGLGRLAATVTSDSVDEALTVKVRDAVLSSALSASDLSTMSAAAAGLLAAEPSLLGPERRDEVEGLAVLCFACHAGGPFETGRFLRQRGGRRIGPNLRFALDVALALFSGNYARFGQRWANASPDQRAVMKTASQRMTVQAVRLHIKGYRQLTTTTLQGRLCWLDKAAGDVIWDALKSEQPGLINYNESPDCGTFYFKPPK